MLNIFGIIWKYKSVAVIVSLVAALGYFKMNTYKLQSTLKSKDAEIQKLSTKLVSEQTKSDIYKTSLNQSNEKIQEFTLLLEENQSIIYELGLQRSSLTKKLLDYEYELASLKEADEHVNRAFQSALDCIEAVTGKEGVECID